MKILLYLAAMAGLFTLPQCTKINALSPSDSIILKDFPVQAGDYWVYKVTSFHNGWVGVDTVTSVDTVTVSVVGSMQAPNSSGTLSILQYAWPRKLDTQYVSIIADTVRVYAYPNETNMKNAFIFPLRVNDNFTSFQIPPFSFDNLDSIQVLLSFDTAIVQDSKIQMAKVYKIKKIFLPYDPDPPLPRRFYAVVDDFAPKIGIVKENREYIRGYVGQEQTFMIETWELLNVHLNEPTQ